MAKSIFTVEHDSSPLAGLNQNEYSYSSFIYPLDLGSPDSGFDNYMIFYINESNQTQYATSTVGSSAPTALPTINQNTQNDAAQGIASTGSQNISRVSTVVALYTPPTLITEYQNQWSSKDLGVAADVFFKEKSISDAVKSVGISGIKNTSDAIGTLTDLNLTDTLGGYKYRRAINNHKEMLFDGVGFRTFNFSFRLTPQSEQEAVNISNIISCFKFYAAPEVYAGSTGRWLTYPAEFDIKFISNGQENLFLNRISTCALTNIRVNYAPTGAGWSSFRPTKDGTMTPGVCTTLDLSFQELEIITKSRVLDYY